MCALLSYLIAQVLQAKKQQYAPACSSIKDWHPRMLSGNEEILLRTK